MVKKPYDFICMNCGKQSNHGMRYIVYQYIRNVKKTPAWRSFCSDNCLWRYYKKVVKEAGK